MLILVRHGRTHLNAEHRLSGRVDVPLDQVGQEQAAGVAALLADAPVRRVVASPLLRTRQTAAPIAAAAGVEVEVDERWVELDYGAWDGMPLVEVPSDTWVRWVEDLHLRPPGGETLVELGVRVRAACDELATAAAGASAGAGGAGGSDGDADGDVVVVSHVSPIKAAVAWALGAGDELGWRLHLSTASVSTIGLARGRPVLHGFNEVGRPGR